MKAITTLIAILIVGCLPESEQDLTSTKLSVSLSHLGVIDEAPVDRLGRKTVYLILDQLQPARPAISFGDTSCPDLIEVTDRSCLAIVLPNQPGVTLGFLAFLTQGIFIDYTTVDLLGGFALVELQPQRCDYQTSDAVGCRLINLQGQVIDQFNAPLFDIPVDLIHEQTQVAKTQLTDQTGTYLFTSVPLISAFTSSWRLVAQDETQGVAVTSDSFTIDDPQAAGPTLVLSLPGLPIGAIELEAVDADRTNRTAIKLTSRLINGTLNQRPAPGTIVNLSVAIRSANLSITSKPQTVSYTLSVPIGEDGRITFYHIPINPTPGTTYTVHAVSAQGDASGDLTYTYPG